MAIFILRVQLSKDTVANYTLLRNKLIKIGFTKRIKSKSGTEYLLPNGNYLVDSAKDIDAIHTIVKNIALTIDKKAIILLSETKTDSWSGLDKA